LWHRYHLSLRRASCRWRTSRITAQCWWAPHTGCGPINSDHEACAACQACDARSHMSGRRSRSRGQRAPELAGGLTLLWLSVSLLMFLPALTPLVQALLTRYFATFLTAGSAPQPVLSRDPSRISPSSFLIVIGMAVI